MADGAAILVLESAETARRRGAPILAQVSGLGLTCDAYHTTAPNGEGAVRAMRQALRDAGIAPEDVGYVNCHGTGTVTNDGVEADAVVRVFGDKIWATSTKSSHGHLLGTAGSIEAIVTTLVLSTGRVPPMPCASTLDPAVRFRSPKGEPATGEFRHAMSNSFGFGGNNLSLVLSQPRSDV